MLTGAAAPVAPQPAYSGYGYPANAAGFPPQAAAAAALEAGVNGGRYGTTLLKGVTGSAQIDVADVEHHLQRIRQHVKIPVYAMIRPRGGDFLYSDQEVEVMRKDIELMKSHRADGLVLGALTEDGRVDAELCMELLGIVCRP